MAGDGYLVENPAMYCLTFGVTAARCGMNVVSNGHTSLSNDGYPSVKYLPVDAGDTWYNLYSHATKATALILPMPDSYSNDGVYHARLGPSYSVHGSGYNDYEVSIGVELHYANGPDYFNLYSCSSPKAKDCNKTPVVSTDHSKLTNSGTLRIVVKAPDADDACDFHVRKAYPQMIKFLNSSKNPGIRVIDPARHIDSSGKAVYADDDDCLELDPQGPNGSSQPMYHSLANMQPLPVQIGMITSDLSKLIEKLPLDDKKKIPLAAINAAAANLDATLPRISQLVRLQGLMAETSRYIDGHSGQLMSQLSAQLNGRLNAQVFGGRKLKVEAQPTKEENQQLEQLRFLQQVRAEIDEFMEDSGGKNGADCRAPVMQVN